ncbi:MAG: hypothetical protein WC836_09720 [Desulfobacula sp.]
MDLLIRQMKVGREAGLLQNPSEMWFKKGNTGVYAVQKDFAHAVHSAENLAKSASKKKKLGLDISDDITKFLAKRKLIVKANEALKSKFSETEQRCISKGFPNEILERHRNMVENHTQNMQRLLGYFNELEQLALKKEWGKIPEVMDRIKSQLDEYHVMKEPPSLSKGLPHDIKSIDAPTIEIEKKEAISSVSPTKMGKEQKKTPLNRSIDKLITKSEAGGIAPMAVTGSPASEDLDPTIDIQITQKIIDLAASLDNSPLKIYEYIQNNFDFDPYLGSRNGSQETLNQ